MTDFSTAKMLIVRESCVTAKENQQRYEDLEKKNCNYNEVLIFLRKKKLGRSDRGNAEQL